jgi:hypothetical protein
VRIVADTDEREKPEFSLEDLESGKVAINPGGLKEVWGKWPGDESIEELLAVLDYVDKARGGIGNGEKF